MNDPDPAGTESGRGARIEYFILLLDWTTRRSFFFFSKRTFFSMNFLKNLFDGQFGRDEIRIRVTARTPLH